MNYPQRLVITSKETPGYHWYMLPIKRKILCYVMWGDPIVFAPTEENSEWNTALFWQLISTLMCSKFVQMEMKY